MRTLLILLLLTSNCFSAVIFSDGLTHNISSIINDTVEVDIGFPGVHTTLNFITGGGSAYSVRGYENSELNFYDGALQTTAIYTHGSAIATVFGGRVGAIYGNGGSNVTILDGSTSWLEFFDNSSLLFMGGETRNPLRVFNSSSVEISGGALTRFVTYDNSSILWSGGNIMGSLDLDDLSVVEISGYDFAVDGVAVGFGDITSVLEIDHMSETPRQLTGFLANGDPIDNQFRIGDRAVIRLTNSIPEPSRIILTLIGLLATTFNRRRPPPRRSFFYL